MSFATLLLAAAAGSVWLDVPFVHQEKNGCGAAVIAMVMQYWAANGAAVSRGDAEAAAIQKQLYSSAAEGIYASAMERYLRDSGFETFLLHATQADLEEQIGKARPVIVCLRDGRSLHYVVVAGFDQARGLVLFNDPARRKLVSLDRRTFERIWKDHWALLAVPRRTR